MIETIQNFIFGLDSGIVANLLIVNLLFLIWHLFFGGPRNSDWDKKAIKHIHVWLVAANVGLVVFLHAYT